MMSTEQTAKPMAKLLERPLGSAGLIWGAIEDLRAKGQIASRQVLAEVTGLKLTTVDDHVKRMVEDGRLRRPLPGVVEIVDYFPEARPVSLTVMPNGLAKIDIGDICVAVSPQERRALAGLLQGDACQLSNILAGQQMNALVGEVWEELKALKRELGG